MATTTGSLTGALTLLAKGAVAAAGVGLVGMALVQFWQVFARYVLNSSPGWTEPVALLFMSFTVMLGAAVAVRQESHFGFYTIRDLSPPPVQRALRILSRVIALATGLALLFWGGQLMLGDWDVPMAGAPLPAGFRFLPLCLGGALMSLFAAERLLAGDPPPAADLDPEATHTEA